MSVDEVAGLVIGQAGTKVMFFWFSVGSLVCNAICAMNSALRASTGSTSTCNARLHHLMHGHSFAKVLLNLESAGREQRGKSRMYSRRLTRGRATGTYSAASSTMNSPVLTAASSSVKIPDIDRDPLGTTGDPGSTVVRALSSLNSYLPDIPRLSLKSLRSAPPTSTSNSAREEREQSRCWTCSHVSCSLLSPSLTNFVVYAGRAGCGILG